MQEAFLMCSYDIQSHSNCHLKLYNITNDLITFHIFIFYFYGSQTSKWQATTDKSESDSDIYCFKLLTELKSLMVWVSHDVNCFFMKGGDRQVMFYLP